MAKVSRNIVHNGLKITHFTVKKILKNFFIIIVLTTSFAWNSYSNERERELNQLFENLKIQNIEKTFKIEQKIWKIWSTHPNDKNLTRMLANGSDLVNNQELIKAVNIFTEIINLDPNWAEAWNKRATVLYMIGEYKKSQDDIDKVLKLEKRHFGALAGQGLVNIELKNYEKAIKSYEKVQEIYPTMKSPKIMINKIKELIKRQSI